jgi:hypothetical protein
MMSGWKLRHKEMLGPFWCLEASCLRLCFQSHLLLLFLHSLSSTNHVWFSQTGHVQPSSAEFCIWPFSGKYCPASSSRAVEQLEIQQSDLQRVSDWLGPFQLVHCERLVSNLASLMEPVARRLRLCSQCFWVVSWWGRSVLSTSRPILGPGGFSTFTRHHIIALHS